MPIPVLNVGRKNAHAEQETERVDEDMVLAPRDVLARIIPLRPSVEFLLSRFGALAVNDRPSRRSLAAREQPC